MSNSRENKKTRLSNSTGYSVRSSPHTPLQTNDIVSTHQQSQPFILLQNDPMTFFSEEIALHIFEVLTPADLGKCACVSRLWYRLVNDQMLWRRLFLGYKFIFPRGLRILEAIMGPDSYKQGSNRLKRRRSSNHLMQPCWKALYKLNYNWVMGQARVTSVSAQELSKRDQSILNSHDPIADKRGGAPRIPHSPIVRFKASTILISGSSGIVHLWKIKNIGLPSLPSSGSQQLEYWQSFQSLLPGSDIPHNNSHLTASQTTCISLDTHTEKDSSGWQKVMVVYSSGHFSVFEYIQQMDGNEPTSLSSISPTETTTKTLNEIGNTASLSSWSNVERVVAAAFCYPIIATCSHNGAISIYMVQGKPSKGSQNWCRLLHTLYGTPPSSPIGISLEKISSSISTELKGIRWRILVSFGLELYDGSWTVRLQETEFSEHQILHSTEIGAEGGDTAETGEKFDGDEGYSSSPSGYSKYISPTSHGRVGPISGISISWPFVVTTHSENTLNVFQLDRRLERGNTQKSTIEGQQPKLLKRRLRFHHLSTLYGHCGAVSSVSIESRSGRLVSASMDRSIKIWTTTVMNHEDLLEQRRVHQCVVSISDIDKSWTESGQVTKEEGSGLIWVGSDDEKIVSMSFDGVVKVWQFS